MIKLEINIEPHDLRQLKLLKLYIEALIAEAEELQGMF